MHLLVKNHFFASSSVSIEIFKLFFHFQVVIFDSLQFRSDNFFSISPSLYGFQLPIFYRKKVLGDFTREGGLIFRISGAVMLNHWKRQLHAKF